jgi:hypothetical protein
MEIPENVYQALREGNAAWAKLTTDGQLNKAKWTVEQRQTLAALAEVTKHTFNAVQRLVKANE